MWPDHVRRAPTVILPETGRLRTVTAIKVPPENKGRLLEMGLLVGTTVELIRFAPLGDPVEIKVRGYNLSLRKHEAELIWVKPS